MIQDSISDLWVLKSHRSTMGIIYNIHIVYNMNTMCLPSYHHNGFVETCVLYLACWAFLLSIHWYQQCVTFHHVTKCISYYKIHCIGCIGCIVAFGAGNVCKNYHYINVWTLQSSIFFLTLCLLYSNDPSVHIICKILSFLMKLLATVSSDQTS